MRKQRSALHDDIEVSIGPHGSRENWGILRVAYAKQPEHQERVLLALRALFPPVTETVTDGPAEGPTYPRADEHRDPSKRTTERADVPVLPESRP